MIKTRLAAANRVHQLKAETKTQQKSEKNTSATNIPAVIGQNNNKQYTNNNKSPTHPTKPVHYASELAYYWFERKIFIVQIH